MSSRGNPRWREELTEIIRSKEPNLKALARKAGLEENYVHSIVNRGVTPTVEKFAAICDVLGISTDIVMRPGGGRDVKDTLQRGVDKDLLQRVIVGWIEFIEARSVYYEPDIAAEIIARLYVMAANADGDFDVVDAIITASGGRRAENDNRNKRSN